MDTHTSSQVVAVSENERPQAVATISQGAQKDNTSSIIGWILRGGVILSATIILAGFLLLLVHIAEQPGYSMSIGGFPHSLSHVWSGLLVLQPEAIIVTGLLFLIATPVITVTTSLVAFAIKHDRRFVVISSVVLAILLASMLIGKGG